MKRPLSALLFIILAAHASVVAGRPAPEKEMPPPGQLELRLNEAVELALLYNYALRQARLDEQDIRREVSQSWSPVWPKIEGTATYTRNLEAPNPFAGTAAGAAFFGGSATDWVEYNQLRLDRGEQPRTYDQYRQDLAAAFQREGVVIDPDRNPFLVENQVQLGLVVRQVLYDGAVFAGLKGSDVAREIGKVGVDVEALRTVRSVASAFYGALLSAQQTEILRKSVDRTQATVDETKQRVERGVVAQFDLLTAEVELANLQTNLARAENAAAKSLDDLRMVVGLPLDRELKPKGELTLEGTELQPPSPADAVRLAFDNRPDLKQAELQVEASRIQESATWGEYLPKVNAVANFAYFGSVPDDRSFTVFEDSLNVGNDPDNLRQRRNGVFSEAYWFPSVSVGVEVNWTIFEGLRITQQRARDRIATMKAKVQLEQAMASVQQEVERSLRELRTAQQQIASQDRNQKRALTNYEHAQVRVREGVSSQFELRQASQQLDESRFNYLQAVHDYLVARVAYLVAIGTPPLLENKTQ